MPPLGAALSRLTLSHKTLVDAIVPEADDATDKIWRAALLDRGARWARW